MSFVCKEQLPNILKKLYMKKVNSLISYENNERTNFSSTQARSKIIFDLESTCNEELWLCVSFDLKKFLTFRKKKFYVKKLISLILYGNTEKRNFFFYAN